MLSNNILLNNEILLIQLYTLCIRFFINMRGIAQSGSVPSWGDGSRGFKSHYSEQIDIYIKSDNNNNIIY